MEDIVPVSLTCILPNLFQNGFVEALQAIAVNKKTFSDKELWGYLINAKYHLGQQLQTGDSLVPLYWALKRTNFSLVSFQFLVNNGANMADSDVRSLVDNKKGKNIIH